MRSLKLPANVIVSGARVLLNPARRINLLSLLLSAFVLGGVLPSLLHNRLTRESAVSSKTPPGLWSRERRSR